MGIEDYQEENERIDFIKGNSTIESINILKDKVDCGDFKVGFGIYPVSFNDITKIGNQNLQMPPKCTYIEPKLITALIMYNME